MAESKVQQKTAYPLPAYNFRVVVNGQSASFAEVSGLAIEYETVPYRHGLSAFEGETIARVKPIKHAQISLKKGTVPKQNFLAEWLLQEPVKGRSMAVSLCDETGAPVVVWKIKEAIPTKLSAPGFDASAKEVSIETLDLMVSGVSVEHV